PAPGPTRPPRTVAAAPPRRSARSVTRAKPSSQTIPAMRACRTSASGFSSEIPPPARAPIRALLGAHCERLRDPCQGFVVITFRKPSGAWRDVLVQPEQVVRVEGALGLGQAG